MGRDRVANHESKGTHSLGKQQLKLFTRTWSGHEPWNRGKFSCLPASSKYCFFRLLYFRNEISFPRKWRPYFLLSKCEEILKQSILHHEATFSLRKVMNENSNHPRIMKLPLAISLHFQDHIAALVTSHMNGLILFKGTIKQTTRVNNSSGVIIKQ